MPMDREKALGRIRAINNMIMQLGREREKLDKIVQLSMSKNMPRKERIQMSLFAREADRMDEELRAIINR
jgi:hypothetical protein